MSFQFPLPSTPEEAMAAGEAWARSIDPSLQVGAIHHIVPRFYLERFSIDGQVCRRAPGERKTQLVNITSLGIRDFYTAVSERRPTPDEASSVGGAETERYLDSALEQILSQIELVRGCRRRREIEKILGGT